MPVEKQIIKTKRLTLRPVERGDFERLTEMYKNPAVMKYIYTGETFSEEESRQRLEGFIKHWEQHGFGMWVLQLHSTAELAGYVGFRYFEDDRPEFNGQVELGYIIDEPYWGLGYASESVCACVQVSFKHYHFKRILATILPENIPSQKVVIKAGLTHTFDAEFGGLMHGVYELCMP